MYWIGIDVAKRKHDIVVLDESGQPVGKPLTIRNNREGIDTLIATLRALDGRVRIALEATGHYWLSLYEQLSKASFDVLVLNPLQVHAYSRSGIRRAKTDKRDAFWVADFLRIGGARPSRVPETTYLQIRDLGRFRFGLIDDIGDCKRKLLSILDRVFPEYETLFSSVFLRSSRELLKKTTNPQKFASFDLAELSNLLRSASRSAGPSAADALVPIRRNASSRRLGIPSASPSSWTLANFKCSACSLRSSSWKLKSSRLTRRSVSSWTPSPSTSHPFPG